MRPIESNRLIITTWTRDDITDATRLWGDPKVMEFIDSRGGLKPDEVEEKLNQEIDRQERFGVQYWKVVLRENGMTIGCCGLRPYDTAAKVYEIGFHVMSEHWGKGVATEAARAVIDYAFRILKVSKLFAGHNPNNKASRAALEKLGFKYIGDQFYAPTGLNHPSYELEFA